MAQMAIFDFIRVQLQYTDKSPDLCIDIIKTDNNEKFWMDNIADSCCYHGVV